MERLLNVLLLVCWDKSTQIHRLQTYPMRTSANLLSSNFNEQHVAKISFDSVWICNKLLQVPYGPTGNYRAISEC